MALIEFKDLPDTTTAINSENLNHNFNELSNNIPENANISTENTGYTPTYRITVSSIDEFKDYLINSANYGIAMWRLQVGGVLYVAISFRLTENLISFLLFNYSHNLTQYKYLNGTWSEVTF